MPFVWFFAYITLQEVLAINNNSQVLGQDMKPIKGLYAAGETAGGLYVGNERRAKLCRVAGP